MWAREGDFKHTVLESVLSFSLRATVQPNPFFPRKEILGGGKEGKLNTGRQIKVGWNSGGRL